MIRKNWLEWVTLDATLALTVQMLFFFARWRPKEIWWRVGAMFAVMMAFLAEPVWEGYPGAFTRVLGPMVRAGHQSWTRGELLARKRKDDPLATSVADWEKAQATASKA